MLRIQGKVVSVTPIYLTNKTTNEPFTLYNAYVVNGGAPVKVKFNDKIGAPKLDKDVDQPVFVNVWRSEKTGRIGYELVAFNPDKEKK